MAGQGARAATGAAPINPSRCCTSTAAGAAAAAACTLCAAHWAPHPRQMVVANRTLERARVLARRFNAQDMTLADLPTRLPELAADRGRLIKAIVILGTGP